MNITVGYRGHTISDFYNGTHMFTSKEYFYSWSGQKNDRGEFIFQAF